jgi:isopentenyl-diphosphate delta-isomerase type 1
MEMFDELDENGKETGRIVSRDDALEKGLWHKASVLWVVNSNNQILIQRRSASKKLWPNLWDISSGGHVFAGETTKQGAVRELEEELGVTVDIKDVVYIGNAVSQNLTPHNIHKHYNEYFLVNKEIDLKRIKLQADEVSEIKWIDFDELKKLIEAKDKTFTDKYDAWGSIIEYMENYNG